MINDDPEGIKNLLKKMINDPVKTLDDGGEEIAEKEVDTLCNILKDRNNYKSLASKNLITDDDINKLEDLYKDLDPKLSEGLKPILDQLKNKNVEKKKEFLQKNGIGVSDINIDLDNFEEEKKQSEKEDTKKMYKTHYNFHKKNNNYIKNYNNINSSEKMNICITLDNDDYKEKNNRNKISFKPKVDQLEFIKKINEEQKIIHTQENTSIKNTKKNKIKNNM